MLAVGQDGSWAWACGTTHDHRAVGQVPGAVQGRRARRAARPAAGDAPDRSRQRGARRCRTRGDSSWSRCCRTSELADVLEEMPEQDQVRLLAGLGLERGADVVEEMEPDDAADLLGRDAARAAGAAAGRDGERSRPPTCAGCCATTRPRPGGLMTSQPLIVAARRPGRRGAGPDPRSPRWPDHGGRAGLRVRAPHEHPDRPLPRHRRVPGAAAPAAGRHRRRVHRGKRLRPAGAVREGGGRRDGRVQPDRRGRLRRGTAACSARSPSTTCWTESCPRAGERRRRMRMQMLARRVPATAQT